MNKTAVPVYRHLQVLQDKYLQGPLFAVIMFGVTQYKVTNNDIIMVDRFPAEIGHEITFKKVMMCGGQRFTAIGRPFLDHVRVTGVAEEHKEAHNVIYYQDKKGQKNVTWKNMRPNVTIVRILNVEYESPEVIGRLDKYRGHVLPDGDIF